MSVKNGNENNEIKKEENAKITSVDTSSQENLKTDVPKTKDAVDSKKEDKVKDKIGKISVKDSFISIIIDQAISLGISAAVLFIIDGIIHLFGWKIANREGMFIILFVVVNIIYNTILHKSKASNTFGEKLAHLKLTK